jgi:superfamily II DNA/RNA helicase
MVQIPADVLILLVASLHGDKDQAERSKIMFAFKNANLPVLVATDVAGKRCQYFELKHVA